MRSEENKQCNIFILLSVYHFYSPSLSSLKWCWGIPEKKLLTVGKVRPNTQGQFVFVLKHNYMPLKLYEIERNSAALCAARLQTLCDKQNTLF